MPPLTVTEHSSGDVRIFVVSGHLVAEKPLRVLESAIAAAMAEGARACLLDLQAVDYIDSAGIGTLVAIYRDVTARGGQLKLLHPSAHARRILGITHLTAVFDVFDSEAEAIVNLGGVHGHHA
jgi:anti-sigma B factor antagonist